MKAIIPLFTLLILLVGSTVQGQYDYTTNSDGTLTITNYNGPDGAVVIPTTIDGLTVTHIGNGADPVFNATNLTSVIIPDTVVSIATNAFWGCAALTNALIGNGVISIGYDAFASTSLTSVTIPDSVARIGSEAFVGTKLTSITIPSSVIDIGPSAFNSLQLTNVIISNGLVSIQAWAFGYCTQLTNITIPKSVTTFEWCVFLGCTNLASIYFQGNAPTIGTTMFNGDPLTVYYLPGTTGWTSFAAAAGVPVVLWNPLVPASSVGFAISNNQFGFDVTGTSNIPIAIDGSASLANPSWTRLQTLILTNGSSYFSDPLSTNYSSRFYRITSP